MQTMDSSSSITATPPSQHTRSRSVAVVGLPSPPPTPNRVSVLQHRPTSPVPTCCNAPHCGHTSASIAFPDPKQRPQSPADVIFAFLHKVTTQPMCYPEQSGSTAVLQAHPMHGSGFGCDKQAALTLQGEEERSAQLINLLMCFLSLWRWSFKPLSNQISITQQLQLLQCPIVLGGTTGLCMEQVRVWGMQGRFGACKEGLEHARRVCPVHVVWGWSTEDGADGVLVHGGWVWCMQWGSGACHMGMTHVIWVQCIEVGLLHGVGVHCKASDHNSCDSHRRDPVHAIGHQCLRCCSVGTVQACAMRGCCMQCRAGARMTCVRCVPWAVLQAWCSALPDHPLSALPPPWYTQLPPSSNPPRSDPRCPLPAHLRGARGSRGRQRRAQRPGGERRERAVSEGEHGAGPGPPPPPRGLHHLRRPPWVRRRREGGRDGAGREGWKQERGREG